VRASVSGRKRPQADIRRVGYNPAGIDLKPKPVTSIPSEKFSSVAVSTLLLTLVAMLAFAANSLLCRRGRTSTDWRSAAMLFTYMVFFSFAYLSLSAGTGALILFGAVQLTMFIAALRGGEHFRLLSWAGLTLALLGLVYLVSPGLTAPDPMGAGLMAIAGIAWGFYSLLGRNAGDPLEATANNFIYSVPLVIIVSLLFIGEFHSSPTGLVLAAISGAITSGLGYVIWYSALRGLMAAHAATVQLSVPAIAAFGGVVFLSEQITLRLLMASIATLGGVWIVLAQRAKRPANLT